MEIKTITSKLVKPATPTQSNLRNYNVSFFDEQIPNLNVPLILYYSTAQNDVHANLFNHLETSLSNTLTDFYPLAGRYVRDGSFIDCSDQGALYVQATANFQLSEFLGLVWELKYNMLRDLLPCEVGEAGEVDDPMLYIKVTTFECGGFAIGMCFSHKLCDMSTMCTFINNWATRSQDVSNALELEKYTPIFSVPRDFPKRDLTDLSPRFPRTTMVTNVARIFIFKGNAISNMREKIIFEDNQGHRPSKVQLVLALLWKAFVGMDKANNNGQSKVSFLSQGVNLRNKAVPKLPDNLCGNFVSVAVAQIEPNEGDNIDLQGFFTVLRDSVKKYDSDYAKALTSDGKEYDVLIRPFLEHTQNMTKSDVNFYTVTSWCRFSFNEADFGWGKPVWKSAGKFAAQNYVVMMDDQEGDGVDAWVHLDEKRMHQLEQDPDIKAYAV